MPGSTYIRNRAADLMRIKEDSIARERQNCDLQVYTDRQKTDKEIVQLRSQRKRKSGDNSGYAIGFVIAFVIIVQIIIGGVTFASVIIGGIIGFAIWTAGEHIYEEHIDEYNNSIEQQVLSKEADFQHMKSAHERRRDQAISKAEQNYYLSLEKEKQQYQATVKTVKMRYGGMYNSLFPMISWLFDAFDKEILAADRNIYNKEIKAVLKYRIEETMIVIIKNNPRPGTPKTEEFIFGRNTMTHYQNVPNFMDRVGLAQTLSRFIELEVKKKYHTDPIAKNSGVPSVKVIDYDDSYIELAYIVYNPNYKVPVRI